MWLMRTSRSTGERRVFPRTVLAAGQSVVVLFVFTRFKTSRESEERANVRRNEWLNKRGIVGIELNPTRRDSRREASLGELGGTTGEVEEPCLAVR